MSAILHSTEGSTEAGIARFYRGTDGMVPVESGDWVRYSDHIAALNAGRKADDGSAVYVFWSESGENIRLWTRDKARAEGFAAEKGLPMATLYASPSAEWFPISTAPKRGEWVLLHGSTSRTWAGMLVARWDGRDWESADDGYGAYITPMHWMPLPLPPAPNQGEAS
jgi:hypothetical protein